MDFFYDASAASLCTMTYADDDYSSDDEDGDDDDDDHDADAEYVCANNDDDDDDYDDSAYDDDENDDDNSDAAEALPIGSRCRVARSNTMSAGQPNCLTTELSNFPSTHHVQRIAK